MATISPVSLNLHMRTSPKAPLPMMLRGSKSFRVIFFRLLHSTITPTYIFLLSSASLCSISCLMSSCSASLRFSFSIFFTSISQATLGYIGCAPTFLLLFLLILQLLILPLDVSFGVLCTLLGSLCHHLLLLLLCIVLLKLRCLCHVCSSSLTDCLLSHRELLLNSLIVILCGSRLLQYL